MKAFHLPLSHNSSPIFQSFGFLLSLALLSLSLSVSLLPLIHGMQHWHIHNQTDLTLHILPQWERRRLRQELYTRPSLLISRSQHQAPPPSISPSVSGAMFALSFFAFFLSLVHFSFFPPLLSLFFLPTLLPYRLVLHHASSPILFLCFFPLGLLHLGVKPESDRGWKQEMKCQSRSRAPVEDPNHHWFVALLK